MLRAVSRCLKPISKPQLSINRLSLTEAAFTEGTGSGTTFGFTKANGETIIDDANSDFSIMLIGERDLIDEDFTW